MNCALQTVDRYAGRAGITDGIARKRQEREQWERNVRRWIAWATRWTVHHEGVAWLGVQVTPSYADLAAQRAGLLDGPHIKFKR